MDLSAQNVGEVFKEIRRSPSPEPVLTLSTSASVQAAPLWDAQPALRWFREEVIHMEMTRAATTIVWRTTPEPSHVILDEDSSLEDT